MKISGDCVLFLNRAYAHLQVTGARWTTYGFSSGNSYWACLLCQALCLVPRGTKVYLRHSFCYLRDLHASSKWTHIKEKKKPTEHFILPRSFGTVGSLCQNWVSVNVCDLMWWNSFIRWMGNQSHFSILISSFSRTVVIKLDRTLDSLERAFEKCWSSGLTPWAVILSVVQRQTALM